MSNVNLIETARDILKECAYEFMTWGYEHYNNPFEFLTGETDQRYATWAFLVDLLLHEKEREADKIFWVVQFAELALKYDCLHEEYFRECIANILAIKELESYHERISNILKTFEALKETMVNHKMPEDYSSLYEAAGVEY